MATTPLQSLATPDAGDTNDIPSDLLSIATELESRTVLRFATTTARDAAITSPVEGMVAVTGTGTGLMTWLYVDGAWVPSKPQSGTVTLPAPDTSIHVVAATFPVPYPVPPRVVVACEITPAGIVTWTGTTNVTGAGFDLRYKASAAVGADRIATWIAVAP